MYVVPGILRVYPGVYVRVRVFTSIYLFVYIPKYLFIFIPCFHLPFFLPAPSILTINRVFAEILVGVGFLWSVSYVKSILTHENYLLWEKVARMPLFNLIFLELGWPWVGEFDGFMILAEYLYMFPNAT